MSTVSLHSGDTIWGIVKARLGAGASNQQILNETNKVLALNNVTAEEARTMQVGEKIKLTQNLAPKPAPKPQPKPAQPTGATPATPTPQQPAPRTGVPLGQTEANAGLPLGQAEANAAQGQTAQAVPERINDPNRISVVEIDNFSPDNTGFNHGQEIGNTINANGNINLQQINIAGGGNSEQLSGRIAAALQSVLSQVKAGADVDAINLSQQNFNPGQQTAKVQDLIRQLSALDVGVLVAAGNGGPNQTNQFAGPGALVVESAQGGFRNSDSGIGNVRAEGASTSFATAGLTPRVAELLNAGLTIQQVLALM